MAYRLGWIASAFWLGCGSQEAAGPEGPAALSDTGVVTMPVRATASDQAWRGSRRGDCTTAL